MTRVQYKNWKTEIAYLRRVANTCYAHANRYSKSPDVSNLFKKIGETLDSRANDLEVAKGAVQQ